MECRPARSGVEATPQSSELTESREPQPTNEDYEERPKPRSLATANKKMVSHRRRSNTRFQRLGQDGPHHAPGLIGPAPRE